MGIIVNSVTSNTNSSVHTITNGLNSTSLSPKINQTNQLVKSNLRPGSIRCTMINACSNLTPGIAQGDLGKAAYNGLMISLYVMPSSYCLKGISAIKINPTLPLVISLPATKQKTKNQLKNHGPQTIQFSDQDMPLPFEEGGNEEELPDDDEDEDDGGLLPDDHGDEDDGGLLPDDHVEE